MNMGDTLRLQETGVACTTPHLFSFGHGENAYNHADLVDLESFTKGLVRVINQYNSRVGQYPVHRLGFVFGVLTSSQTRGLSLVREFGFTVFESRPCHKYNHRLYMATMDCQEMHERIGEIDPEGYESIRKATAVYHNPLPALPKKGKD